MEKLIKFLFQNYIHWTTLYLLVINIIIESIIYGIGLKKSVNLEMVLN